MSMLVKKRDNIFFKIIVMMVITSFVITSVPEYTWAYVGTVVLTDFSSYNSIMGSQICFIKAGSRLVSPSYLMKKINNEKLKNEIINSIETSSMLNGLQYTNSKTKFNLKKWLKNINGKIYRLSKSSLEMITTFNRLHVKGINDTLTLSVNTKYHQQYSNVLETEKIFAKQSLGLLKTGLSGNKIKQIITELQRYGLPVNAATVLAAGRALLFSSRDMIQTKKMIVVNKNKKENRKINTNGHGENNIYFLNTLMKIKQHETGELNHINSLAQGIRGSPEAEHRNVGSQAHRKIRAKEQKDTNEGEEDGPPSKELQNTGSQVPDTRIINNSQLKTKTEKQINVQNSKSQKNKNTNIADYRDYVGERYLLLFTQSLKIFPEQKQTIKISFLNNIFDLTKTQYKGFCYFIICNQVYFYVPFFITRKMAHKNKYNNNNGYTQWRVKCL